MRKTKDQMNDWLRQAESVSRLRETMDYITKGGRCPIKRDERTIMQVIRINKRTGERTIAAYANDLSPEENLVSDILLCNGMAGQLMNDSDRETVRRSLGHKGRMYITGESQEYDHLARK